MFQNPANKLLTSATAATATRARAHARVLRCKRSGANAGMKMVWGGNIIRTAPGQAGYTHLTTITHINPGGIGETRFGNLFCEKNCDELRPK